MWKTVSEDCNLACDYCYYSTCNGKPGAQVRNIDLSLLEKFIADYMSHNRGSVSFAWQGGEPLLAGLSFFESAIALQVRYAPPHTSIGNSLQTNGTLLNDRWAAFFKQYNFLIGVSLDGPQPIHDARRVDASGNGSFERVMKGIGALDRHQVDYNILTVIHQGNVGRAAELMAFYRRHRFPFVQFIPCMSFHSQRADEPGTFEISAEAYGDFLCEAFDEWYNDGNPACSIRTFDSLLYVYLHREAELCTHRDVCPPNLILEPNGDAYPCDFYMDARWKLGNVAELSIAELLAQPKADDFWALKSMVPDDCLRCDWFHICRGGCPRNRVWTPEGRPAERDSLCESYRKLFAHADGRLRALSERLRTRWFDHNVRYQLRGKRPVRNEPCACGSGRKFKQCCVDLPRIHHPLQP
ncbi:anaerobic sulfatase maturase [Paenibacillus sp. TRM 82003]|nr:anaerobic sulfatase maturase [Paenibacillus sp. TRM 82003]